VRESAQNLSNRYKCVPKRPILTFIPNISRVRALRAVTGAKAKRGDPHGFKSALVSSRGLLKRIIFVPLALRYNGQIYHEFVVATSIRSQCLDVLAKAKRVHSTLSITTGVDRSLVSVKVNICTAGVEFSLFSYPRHHLGL
jgi:hypothetical protein